MNRLHKPVPRAMLWLAAVLLPLSAVAQDETVRLNKLIEMFLQEDPAFGLLSFDYSLSNARSLASSGLDFVLIDMDTLNDSVWHSSMICCLPQSFYRANSVGQHQSYL